ncbi:MAG: S8 family serine peptidase [Planctomycetaceae bacterium]
MISIRKAWLGVLGACLLPCGAMADGPVQVLIRFSETPGAAQRDLVRGFGGTVHQSYRLVPAVAATLPEQALEALKNAPGVEAVEPDGEMQAHASAEYPWGVLRIGCEPLHLGTYPNALAPITGLNIKVAVLDSGINYNHADLAANYAGGYDFINNDSDPLDDNGHGTHVSGTIAAVGNGTGVIGVAPQAKLYGVKVLGANGSGSFSAIISGLQWCIDNKIAVANLSLGSSTDPGTTVQTAFNNAYAAGLVIVASAGNSGAGVDTVGYPAKYASVIAVGSTTSTDALSSFSSTGPAVELAAPGSSIYSTVMSGGYGTMSGTSMASPHVTGVAALVVSTGLADSNANGLINDEVRTILQTTAQDLGTAGRDNSFGYGLVDADAAVVLALAGGGGGGGGGGGTVTFDPPTNLAASLTSRTVRLTWTDNSNSEDGFEVQQGTVKGSSVTWKVVTTTAASATAYQFSVGKGTFRFRVRAKKGTTYTAYSNEVQLTVP